MRAQRFAIGCLLLPASFFGGGMIAVGIAKIVDTVRGCRAPEDLPACDTFTYFFTGGVVGAIVLMVVVQWLLGRKRPGVEQSNRS